MMKNLMVYLDEDFHESLKELAHRKKTTMAALVRYAVDLTFKDDLDALTGERPLQEYLADPSGAISLDDSLREQNIVLPPPTASRDQARSKKASSERTATRARSGAGAG